MTPSRRITILAIVAFGALALTGCAPAVYPHASPSHMSEPTPSASAAPVEPSTRLDIACDDLASPAALAPVLSHPVTAQSPAAVALAEHSGIPYSYFVQQAGGLECLWSDGAPASSVTGAESSSSASLVVLPDAAAGWAKYQNTYGFTSDKTVNCLVNNGDGCQYDALVGTSWIEATIGKLSTPPLASTVPSAAAAAFFAHVAGVVRAAHSVGAALPAATATDCDKIISIPDLGKLLGVSAPLSEGGADGGDSIEFTGASQVGLSFCFANLEGSDDGVASYAMLPGAAWAAREAAGVAKLPSSPASITIPGLAASELADIRYSAATREAVLDFTLRGNWMEVVLYPVSSGGLPISGDVRTKLTAVAAKIVANLS
jgi:hypothetical protein